MESPLLNWSQQALIRAPGSLSLGGGMYLGQHYRQFLEGTPDAFFITDVEGRIIDVNRQACVSLGYEREQLLAMTVGDIDAAVDVGSRIKEALTLEPGDTFLLVSRHRRRDGSEFPVEVHIGIGVADDGQRINFAVVRDISERVEAERRQARLTNLYRALSEINQMIVRAEAPLPMFERVCRIAVELGGMRLAWIGERAADSDRIEPVSMFGDGQDYVRGITVSVNPEMPEGRGPTGTAYREQRHVIAENFQQDATTGPWHEQGRRHQLGSSASFPILRGGASFAVLSVYHEHPQAFDTEVVALLDEAVTDIGFALDNFDRESQRLSAERKNREQSNFLQAIFDSEPECVKVISPDGHLLQMNRAGLAMLEVENVEQVEETGLFEFVAPEFRAAFAEFHSYVCAGNSGHFEFRVKGRKGTERWLETHATPLRDAEGSVVGHLGVTRDITERKRFDELVWCKANFDQLTSLPNRNMFQDRLRQELKKASRNGEIFAVLFIDLDRFKEVNDTLGHQAGDELLVSVAHRIAGCLRESDTVARLGGDEFMVLLSGLNDIEPVKTIAGKIVEKLAEPFLLGDGQSACHISASIGVTVYPADGNDADQLLRNVDQAMYVAKAHGRNCYAWFTPKLREQTQQRMSLLQDLRGAIPGGQLSLCFQPIVDLRDGRIVKLEALVRWQHPVRGAVSPVDFIPLAEESGLILEIGDWVAREAMYHAQRWIRSGVGDLQIGINVSPVQLHRATSRVDVFFQYLQEFGLDGSNLALEITEGLLLHPDEKVRDILARLRKRGIELAIDDFGTGYSALSYLKNFDIDYLKIDRSFIRDLEADPNDRALSEAIIVMAHKLGLQVIAEGVETQGQRDLLVAAGCDFAQGYFFSMPLPVAAIDMLLRDSMQRG